MYNSLPMNAYLFSYGNAIVFLIAGKAIKLLSNSQEWHPVNNIQLILPEESAHRNIYEIY